MRDRIAPIFLANVFDDIGATVVREVNVDIGRVDAFGIEKALEQQAVADGIDVRDFEQISDDGTGGGTPGHASDPFAAAELNKVSDD